MAIKLHQKAFEQSKKLIKAAEYEDFSTDWEEHNATPDEVDKYIDNHSMQEYGLWFLGVNTDYPENTQEHYEFPYGDLKLVHKSALEAAQEAASAEHLDEIEDAASELIALIDEESNK